MGGGDHYPSVQKGQTPPNAVGTMYAVGMQCAVGVSAKRSYGWWGPLPFSAKRSNPPNAVGTQYAVGMQCTVGVSAKRSYGWWGPLPLSTKMSTPPCSGYAVRSGYAVHSRCKCEKVIWVVGTITLQCKKVKPPTQWVRSAQWVRSMY